MAEEQHHYRSGEEVEGEVKDRGLFDFMDKEEEKKCHRQEVVVTKFENVKVDDKEANEEEEKKEKHSILEKLHGSDSSSSSSSDEEEEGENKGEKKKKKGLKEKIKEKMPCDKEEEEEKDEMKMTTILVPPLEEDTSVRVERVEFTEQNQVVETPEEKKGFLDKIKEKLPGHQKKPTEETPPAAATTPVECGEEHGKTDEHEGEGAKEKKGFLGKIMDKIPGYNKSADGGEHEGNATH